jgi:mannose-6-phosphate isomerase-like protein (cupin superfamily)
MRAVGELVVVAPGEGPAVSGPNGTVTIKLSGAQSNGALAVYESARTIEAEAGIHSHPGFDEMFYVIGGSCVFTAGDRTIEASPGAFLYVPRGMFHGIRSSAGGRARLLTICAPGEIEDLLGG